MRKLILLALSCLLLFSACEEGLEINAPFQDIWVVYGVLSVDDSTQYIRISKVFQTESNAFTHASENDYTVKGLKVELTGNGQTLEAVQVDSLIREPGGDFPQQMTVYRFDTRDDQRLEEGIVYTLRITSDSLPDFFLTATTRTPPGPSLMRPVPRRLVDKFCLETVTFEDSFEVVFRTRSESVLFNEAYGHEIRVKLAYLQQGEPQRYTYGPTKLFTRSSGCTVGIKYARCYKFRNAVVMNSMRGHFLDPLARYQYVSLPNCAERRSELSEAVRIEVTAVDSILGRYMEANDPRYLNVNTIRPEYTNITGSQDALGIFGSINIDVAPVALSECAKYFLHLNGTLDPGYCQ